MFRQYRQLMKQHKEKPDEELLRQIDRLEMEFDQARRLVNCRIDHLKRGNPRNTPGEPTTTYERRAS